MRRGRGCITSHFITFSGLMVLNCCVMMALPSVSVPVICGVLMAAPTRKALRKVSLSVAGAGAWATAVQLAKHRTDAKQEVR